MERRYETVSHCCCDEAAGGQSKSMSPYRQHKVKRARNHRLKSGNDRACGLDSRKSAVHQACRLRCGHLRTIIDVSSLGVWMRLRKSGLCL
eukprot:2537063-Amphidinium_carterae.1